MKKRRGISPVLRICITAMLVAMSVVIGIICRRIDFGNGIRITFENLPLIIVGLMFGPIYGAMAGAISDIISCIYSAYAPNPLILLGAALMGAIPGIVSRFIFKRRSSVQILVSVVAAHLIGSVTVKTLGLVSMYSWGIVFTRIPVCLLIMAIELVIILLLFSKVAFRKLLIKFDGGKR